MKTYRVFRVHDGVRRELTRSPIDRSGAVALAESHAVAERDQLPNNPRVEPMGGFGEGADVPRFDIVMGGYTVRSFTIEATA